jgi:hypothetical protein
MVMRGHGDRKMGRDGWACFFIFCGLLLVGGTGCPATVWAASAPVEIRHQIPFGAHRGALVASGSSITVMLCLQNNDQIGRRIDFELTIPPPLVPVARDPDLTALQTPGGWVLQARPRLEVAGEKWFTTLQIEIPEKTPAGSYTFFSTASVADAAGEPAVEQRNRLQVVSAADLADLFTFGPLVVPTNEMGERDPRQQAATILLRRHAARFWERLTVPDDPNKTAGTKPAAFAALRIQSRAALPATLMVRLDILDPLSQRVAPGFEIPYAEEHGIYAGGSGIYQILSIPAGGTETAVLPIHTNDALVMPGTYAVRAGVALFGSDVRCGQREEIVQVASGRLFPALATLFSLATAVFGVLFFAVRRRSFFDLPARTLILIAFFGAVTFAVVNIPGTLLFHAAHVILGPLSFLVTGFFYEVIFYLLMTSLLVLIPRFGALSLAIAVRFLMSAFILGEFSPLSLLYYPTMAVVLESAAWLSGLTRQPHSRRVLVCAVVFGLGDALLSLVFFNLSMFFYRLYYAGWYIAAYALINGFGFTCLAVPFGFRLGRRLKEAAHV